MKFQKLKVLFTFLLSLTIHICSAQDTTKRWSLQDCLSYAKAHNISLQQAQADVNISKDQKMAAKGQLLPSVNGNVSQNYNIGLGIDPATNQKINQTVRSNGFGINAGWNLFNGFSVWNGIKKASWDVKASKYLLQQKQHDLTIQIVNEYLKILLNAEMLQAAKSQFAVSKQFYKDMQIQLEAGEKAKADLANAAAQLANDRQQEIMAENNLQIARRNLAQSLQLREVTHFHIVYNIPSFADTTLLHRSLDQIYAQVLEKYPAIKQGQAKIKSATLNWRMYKSYLWPSIGFGAGINTFYSNNNEAPFKQQFNENTGYSFGFSLSIPLFNNLYYRSNIHIAERGIKKAELQQKQNQYDLWQAVQTVYSDMHLYRRAFQASEEAENALEKALSYAQISYKSGNATYYEYLQARDRWQSARSQSIQNKYTYLYNALLLKYYFEAGG